MIGRPAAPHRPLQHQRRAARGPGPGRRTRRAGAAAARPRWPARRPAASGDTSGPARPPRPARLRAAIPVRARSASAARATAADRVPAGIARRAGHRPRSRCRDPSRRPARFPCPPPGAVAGRSRAAQDAQRGPQGGRDVHVARAVAEPPSPRPRSSGSTMVMAWSASRAWPAQADQARPHLVAPGREPGDRGWRRRPAAGVPSPGAPSRPASSSTIRWAPLRPMPGTVISASRSSAATARRSASGLNTASIARASRGPTPLAVWTQLERGPLIGRGEPVQGQRVLADHQRGGDAWRVPRCAAGPACPACTGPAARPRRRRSRRRPGATSLTIPSRCAIIAVLLPVPSRLTRPLPCLLVRRRRSLAAAPLAAAPLAAGPLAADRTPTGQEAGAGRRGGRRSGPRPGRRPAGPGRRRARCGRWPGPGRRRRRPGGADPTAAAAGRPWR